MNRALLLSLLLLSVSVAVYADDKSLPIIDVHAHVYGSDPRWTGKVPNPATGQALMATDEASHRKATLAAFEKYRVETAIVSNDFEVALRWKEADGSRIRVSYAFNDPRHADLDLIRKEHAAGRLVAIGEIGTQYAGISPDDPRMEPIWALAEELDLPVAIHMGLGAPGSPYTCCPGFRTTLGNPQLLEPVLVRHPKLRLSIMHAGYPYLEETKAILYMYPQVYADVSVINWILPRKEFYGYLQALMKAGNGKRLMYGSDQMVWPDAIGLSIETIRAAPFLSEAEKRDLFYNNARVFFRLDPGAKAVPAH